MINAIAMNNPNTLVTAIILVFHILFCLTSNGTCQSSFISRVCQDTFGNYTAGSTFKTNLDTLLTSITSNTDIDYGFYNFSAGHGFDTVHGIGLCRPDLSVADCHRCLADGAAEIVQQCPTQKDAIGWYERCMIRYTDRYIFGKMELGPWYHLENPVSGADEASFNRTVLTLVANLQRKAASGNSRYKFAAGEVNVSDSLTIYALVQCTPDLEEYDCYACLDNAVDFSFTNLFGLQASVFFTSCNIRYQSYLFFDPTNLISLPPPPSASLPPSITTNTRGRRIYKSKILISILAFVTSLALLAALIGCYYLRRRRPKAWAKDERDEVRTPESLQMDFSTIKAATGNFSDSNKLGRGGFGIVYKGTLPDGHEVAVKRLLRKSGHGDVQFKNEILILAKLQHKNLVRLLGFCMEEEEKLIIYELLNNGSLDNILFDPVHRASMLWDTRYKIINGIARGLLYLHEESRLRIIHRDLKAGNVLLDTEFNPKIADFGMARLFNIDHTQTMASRIVGTYGYMAPEYALHGCVSMKLDVFSFGVLVLEIITGQRISSFQNEESSEGLLNYAWKIWQEGTPWKIIDPALSNNFSKEMMECIHIGLLCVQHNLTDRPTMGSVVLMLSNCSHTLPVPLPPGFSSKSNKKPKSILLGHTSDQFICTLTGCSVDNASITELDPR